MRACENLKQVRHDGLATGQITAPRDQRMGSIEKSTGAIWDMVTKLTSLELEY